MTEPQRKRYYDIAMDLHEMQGRGVEAARALTPFHTQMTEIAGKIDGMANVPADVKAQFDRGAEGMGHGAREVRRAAAAVAGVAAVAASAAALPRTRRISSARSAR